MKKLKTHLKTQLENNNNFKIINVNGVDVKLTRLGLRHLAALKSTDPNSGKAVENYAKIFKDDCTWSEGEFILFHVEHFNAKLPNQVEYKGNIFKMSDVKMDSETSFELNDEKYEFRPLYFFESFKDAASLLKEKYKSGPEVKDWNQMPAFVISWANKIRNTISVIGSNGLVLNDGALITEIFRGDINEQ